MIYKRSS